MEAKKKQVKTRKDEVRLSTSDPKEMLDKYLAEDLKRGWLQDFVDEDTSEVVSVQRYEIIAPKGKLIDKNLLSQIQFFLSSGEVTTVEVSNQCREATLQNFDWLSIWSVDVRINRKKRRFLLYANSIEMALEVAKDFVELHFDKRFYFVSAKAFQSAIILTDNLKPAQDESDGDSENNPFYHIEVNVVCENIDTAYTFVIKAKDVDSAMIVINNSIANRLKSRQQEGEDAPDFTATVVSAVMIPCYKVIEREFSEAYIKE